MSASLVSVLYTKSYNSFFNSRVIWASLVAPLVKNLPAIRETRVRSLGWEDRLEKGTATHYSILGWRIPRGHKFLDMQFFALISSLIILCLENTMGFPGGSVGKESAYNAGEADSTPGSRRSPGKGNGNPLQYSCLENPMDRGTWWATVHEVTNSGHGWTTNSREHTSIFELFEIVMRCPICAIKKGIFCSCLIVYICSLNVC